MKRLKIIVKILTAWTWKEEIEFFKDLNSFLEATDKANNTDESSTVIDVHQNFINSFFLFIAAHLHGAKNYKSMLFSEKDTGIPVAILTLEKYGANSPAIENERLKQLLRDNGISYE